MTRLRSRCLYLSALVAALTALIASLVWAMGVGSGPWRPGPGVIMGALSRESPVHGMADADRAAGHFAERRGLRVGEVMRSGNGYHGELLAPDGRGASSTRAAAS